MKQLLRLLCVIVLALVTSKAHAQTKVPGRFRADITYMMPQRYQSRTVTDFYLEIKDDTVDLYLPYMGEVYVPTFGHDGLRFTEKVTKRSYGKGKKGVDVISFYVKHDIATYVFHLMLYAGGETYIHMTPSNAQSCSYSGSWEEKP